MCSPQSLPPQQSHSASSEKPSLQSLLDNVKVTEWHRLGLNLGVSQTDLDFIAADHLLTEVSLRRTFQCALEQDPFLSWQKVARVLRTMNKNSLARDIQDKFC